MRFTGQVALVTGAGRGIGKTIALALAREGADVAIADLEGENAEKTAAEVQNLGRRSFAGVCDVRDHAAVQKFVTGIVGALGKIDVLVNDAGIAKAQPFLEITPENWDNHLRTHLFGTFYCSQAAARDMAQRRYGRIVTIASVAGLMGPIDLAPYGAAKAGMIGLTRAMAFELADYGITANAVAPGPIDTELLRKAWTKEALEERANHIPARRLGTVEEVAHAVLFLASPEAAYVSGAVLVIDGGSVAAGAYMVEQYRRRRSKA
ncbi:MAG: SDR family NAD(P)-dependent oxidoreductase [Candidatus Binatia bacterium]